MATISTDAEDEARKCVATKDSAHSIWVWHVTCHPCTNGGGPGRVQDIGILTRSNHCDQRRHSFAVEWRDRVLAGPLTIK